MKIAIFGLGYVGMANAALLARQHEVVAVDVDQTKVDIVNAGRSPIADEDIKDYIAANSLSLSATLDPRAALSGADFAIIATPTNYNPETNYFDTNSVEAVLLTIAKHQDKPVAVIKSTVPVGFTSRMAAHHADMKIVFSPEFLREGRALYDSLHPSRIVTSGPQEVASKFAEILLEASADGSTPTLTTGTTEAEAIKLFANTYLAMRVAFVNELDSFALAHNLDTKQIVRGVGLDPRIGSHYNNPSFGYGGYCLPKDTRQLLANFSDVPQTLVKAVVDSNQTRMDFIASQVIKRGPKLVGVHRLTMKTNSDNFRESSVQDVANRLVAAGIEVIVYEPLAAGDKKYPLELVNDLEKFKRRSDLIIANRMAEELKDVAEKVYTRDLFGVN